MKENASSPSRLSDEELRTLLQRHSLTAPPSPWFTRKVMNRLPPRKVRGVALAEYSVYALCAAATIVFAIFYILDTIQTGRITVGNLTVLTSTFGLLCAILYLGVSPWFTHEPDHTNNVGRN